MHLLHLLLSTSTSSAAPILLPNCCIPHLRTVAKHQTTSKLQLPVGRRLSGHNTWDAVPRRYSQKLSRAETEYYDAVSVHDTEHEQQLTSINSAEELNAIAMQLQEQLQQRASGGVPGVSGAAARLAMSSGGSRPPWMPETPLLFARKCCCCCCFSMHLPAVSCMQCRRFLGIVPGRVITCTAGIASVARSCSVPNVAHAQVTHLICLILLPKLAAQHFLICNFTLLIPLLSLPCALLQPRVPASCLCLRTVALQHTGRMTWLVPHPSHR
jgi:hypothetical protein